MRGRYPESSKSVNRGKKIAIGGNITAITQADVRYTPKTRTPCTQAGAPIHWNQRVSWFWKAKNQVARNAEGIFAPSIVIQKTPTNKSSMSGYPNHLEVTRYQSFDRCLFVGSLS